MKFLNRNIKLLIPLAGAMVLILALMLFYRISEPYLWTDEVFSYLAAQKIVETGKPILDTGLEYTRSPIYHYTLAFFLENFGGTYSENLFASRIPNILAILLTSLITYLFTLDIIRSVYTGKTRLIHYLVATIPVMFFLSSNFTVSLARETRMYAFAQFGMLAITYSFYKAIIEDNQSKAKLNLFGAKVNILWSVIFAISIFIATFIQPITLLVGIGIIIFLTFYAYVTRNYVYLLLIILALLILPIAGVLLYQTANPIEIFQFMNPNWGESSSYIYYLLLGVRNIPTVILLIPVLTIATYFSIHKKHHSMVYSAILITTYIAIISILSSKNERYLQPIVPLIFIFSTASLYLFYVNFYKQINILFKGALFTAIGIATILHSYLYIKELNEISTYTSSSIMQHKKMNFVKIIDILDYEIGQNADVEISADYHSAFTLYTMGYNVKNILITTGHIENRIQGSDKYIGIPYLYYDVNFEEEIIDENKDIIVIRDPNEYITKHGISNLLVEKYRDRPLVFLER